MKNGRFTKRERGHLGALDAVERVYATRIVYADGFKHEFMRRYNAGEKPGEIFASAGMPASLVGHKRIERAAHHWRQAERRDALGLTGAPETRSDERKRRARRDKRRAVERQRAMRKRDEERYKRKIRDLRAEVELLKAEGSLASGPRAGQTTKTQRFAPAERTAQANPGIAIAPLRAGLGVSRSGYYRWLKAAPARHARAERDRRDAGLVAGAFRSHGFAKGSRKIVESPRDDFAVTPNRKKVLRLTDLTGLRFKPGRRNPYHPVDTGGGTRIAPNPLDRAFHPGTPRTTPATDITYLKHDGGTFAHPSPAGDTQTNEPLSWQLSQSLRMPFVIRTLDGLKDAKPAPGALIHSDQGVHYTCRAHRDKIARTRPDPIHEPQGQLPRQRLRRIVLRPHESPPRPHQPPDLRPTRPTHQRLHGLLHQPQTTGPTQQTNPQTIRNTTRGINRPLSGGHIKPPETSPKPATPHHGNPGVSHHFGHP